MNQLTSGHPGRYAQKIAIGQIEGIEPACNYRCEGLRQADAFIIYGLRKNRRPTWSFGTRSIQVGHANRFNWTVSYNVAHNLWIGSSGYYLKHIVDCIVLRVVARDGCRPYRTGGGGCPIRVRPDDWK